MDIGPQAKSDNAMTAKYRLLQSKYRAEVLKEDFGSGPTKNSKTRYGNMLINGEETGSNFISDAAFNFSKIKVEQKQINKALTIDEFRLYNNMLSSMPMCFNLFSDLRKLLHKDPAEASRIAKALFPELPWIELLLDVDVEFIPVPIQDYTNDKSALDAMLIVQDTEGKRGLISIETKYTDVLGGNAASDSVTKNALVENGNFFDEELETQLKEKGYLQIHRNFLLTYAYATKQGFDHFVNIVVSPEEDKLSVTEIDELHQHMTQYQDRIFKIPLETVVERGINCGNADYSQIMTRFQERYITNPGRSRTLELVDEASCLVGQATP